MVVKNSGRKVGLFAAFMFFPSLVWADHPIGVFGPTAGGPVITPTANTLPSGSWGFSFYNEYRRFESKSPAELEAQALNEGHVHALDYLWAPSLAASYGLSDSFTVTAVLPYVKRDDLEEAHVHHGVASVHELGDIAGEGDITVAGYWRFREANNGFAAALSFGSFLPVGKTDEQSKEGDRLETEYQPGSGAWRPFLGITLSRSQDKFSFHTNLRYTLSREGAQQTDLGDKIDYGAALSYRLSRAVEEPEPHEHAPGTGEHVHLEEDRLQWDALLEVVGEYTRPHSIAGVTEGSVEHIVYLAPGIRLTGSGGWTAALSLGLPVYQDPGRGHIETGWRAVLTAAFSL